MGSEVPPVHGISSSPLSRRQDQLPNHPASPSTPSPLPKSGSVLPGVTHPEGVRAPGGPRPLLPPAAQELLAGFAAGAANVTSGYPFDTVKVRLQSASPGQYRGALHCLREVVRSEGVRRGLFRGLSSPLVGGTAETGVNYLVYSRLLAALQRYQQQQQAPAPQLRAGGGSGHTASGVTDGTAHLAPPPPLSSPSSSISSPLSPPPPLRNVALAGAVAGACLSVILGPTELVKCRMQQAGASSRYPGGPLQCLREIVRHEGGALRGLSRGLGATMAREVPGNAIFFAAYEGLRRVVLGAAGTTAVHHHHSPATVQHSLSPSVTPSAAGAGAVEAGGPTGVQPGLGSPDLLGRSVTVHHAGMLPDLIARAEGRPGEAAAGAPVVAATAAATGRADQLGPAGRHWLMEAALAVFCGGAAGTIMWAAVLPIDVAKTRLQTATPDSDWDVGLRRHWRMLWREGGMRSLYAGLVPTLARAFPANACQWLAWELAMRGLQGEAAGAEEGEAEAGGGAVGHNS